MMKSFWNLLEDHQFMQYLTVIEMSIKTYFKPVETIAVM